MNAQEWIETVDRENEIIRRMKADTLSRQDKLDLYRDFCEYSMTVAQYCKEWRVARVTEAQMASWLSSGETSAKTIARLEAKVL